MKGQNCYVGNQVCTHADNMGYLVEQEEAEAAALEQAATRFLQIGRIRYGFDAGDKFSTEDLLDAIGADGDMTAERDKAFILRLEAKVYPENSVERGKVLCRAQEIEDDLAHRAAIAMLQPHVGYFMELDTLAA